jgi:hypothetical protein
VGSFVLVELVVDRGGDVFEAFELAERDALVGFVELIDQAVAAAFTSVLGGRDPRTGERLISDRGSAGRVASLGAGDGRPVELTGRGWPSATCSAWPAPPCSTASTCPRRSDRPLSQRAFPPGSWRHRCTQVAASHTPRTADTDSVPRCVA